VGEVTRELQPAWVQDARRSMRDQQDMVVQDLEEKAVQAPDAASDEFMYQDKAEAGRELAAARRMLADLPAALQAEELQYRTWNQLPYHRYRGDDETNEN
jgi:sulfate adenylyltransferase